MATLAETWFAEGKELGIAEGIAEGLAQGMALGMQKGVNKGMALLLLDILENRFGLVPPAVRQRVENADMEMISTWSRRAMDAASLDQVINPEKG